MSGRIKIISDYQSVSWKTQENCQSADDGLKRRAAPRHFSCGLRMAREDPKAAALACKAGDSNGLITERETSKTTQLAELRWEAQR